MEEDGTKGTAGKKRGMRKRQTRMLTPLTHPAKGMKETITKTTQL